MGRLFTFTVLVGLAGCAPASSPPPSAASDVTPADYRLSFAPLPARFVDADRPVMRARVDLGRKLFSDPLLSIAGDISCASCHDLVKYGIDGRKTAIGHRQQVGTRNTPTVYNVGGFVAQFWDGRSVDVEAQSMEPILNPIEMAMPNRELAVERMRRVAAYQSAFAAAFPGEAQPITYDNMATAIGAFERGLVTPGRFDQFLRGDKAALTAIEERGFRRYVELGCASCHNGPALGGLTFERLGIAEAYPNRSDLGLSVITKRPEDDMKFRVPGLRNIEHTGPYFHDGSIDTLEKAVDEMAKYQVGVTLTDQDRTELVAFLRALTGEIPRWYIGEPTIWEQSEPAAGGQP